MEDILRYQIEISDQYFQQQLQFILEELISENEERYDSDDDGDENSGDFQDDDDGAVVEDEEFAEYPFPSTVGQKLPHGEELLCNDYLASEVQATEDMENVRKSLEVEKLLKSKGKAIAIRQSLANDVPATPLSRPITPLQRRLLVHRFLF
jgi:hypothetical protein